MAGLACWSFLMAGAHGAGLMLVPALLPLCTSPVAGGTVRGDAVVPIVLALGVHTGAMLLAISAIALLVYDRIGLAFLRTGWINLDLMWRVALVCSVAWRCCCADTPAAIVQAACSSRQGCQIPATIRLGAK